MDKEKAQRITDFPTECIRQTLLKVTEKTPRHSKITDHNVLMLYLILTAQRHHISTQNSLEMNGLFSSKQTQQFSRLGPVTPEIIC